MFAVTILGNNSAVPAFNRHPTSQVVTYDGANYLVDCGEGTQIQMINYKIRRSKISHIFISHLHGDHYFGLIGLLTSMGLLARTQDLHLHCPPPLEEIINLQLRVADTVLPYKMYFHPLGDEGVIAVTNKITVSCFKVSHRIDCWGFLFRERKNPRSIIPEKVKAYDIPAAFYEELQKGNDYVNKKGTIIPNEEVTVAVVPAKSYAFCADTIYDEGLAEKVKEVTLLYHETTYLKDHPEKALARYHSTTVQAAAIAQKAGAQKLLIGHFSSKYEEIDQFLTETIEVFPNTELALEGACYKI